jgi:hypothetical protein
MRIPIVPGCDPMTSYGNLTSRGIRGIVLEAFGVGNIPERWTTDTAASHRPYALNASRSARNPFSAAFASSTTLTGRASMFRSTSDTQSGQTGTHGRTSRPAAHALRVPRARKHQRTLRTRENEIGTATAAVNVGVERSRGTGVKPDRREGALSCCLQPAASQDEGRRRARRSVNKTQSSRD